MKACTKQKKLFSPITPVSLLLPVDMLKIARPDMLKITRPMFLFNAHYMAHCAYKNLLSLV